MAFAEPKTSKFLISTAELRVGPLTSAGNLTEAHSVGLVDSVNVSFTTESQKLKGGLPKRTYDTQKTDMESSVTGSLREYSQRNMSIMLGNGATAGIITGGYSTIASAAAAGATTVDLADGTIVSAEDFVTLYPVGKPEKVSVCRVTAVASNTLTLDAGTPTLHDYAQDDLVVASKAAPVGDISAANYVSASLIYLDRAGRPQVWNFWKADVTSGLNADYSADDFASTDMSLEIIQPSAADYAAGGDLDHLASVIPDYPIGLLAQGGDT